MDGAAVTAEVLGAGGNNVLRDLTEEDPLLEGTIRVLFQEGVQQLVLGLQGNKLGDSDTPANTDCLLAWCRPGVLLPKHELPEHGVVLATLESVLPGGLLGESLYSVRLQGQEDTSSKDSAGAVEIEM